MFGVMNHLDIAVCEDADDAAQKGYKYDKRDGFNAIEITKVVVVQNGTIAGNPTVDFILEDETGNKFVVMVTGALLKAIPC